MIQVYFFYGLSFMFMAFILFFTPRKDDLLGLRDDILFLGLFGLSHGLYEWVELLILQKAFNAAILTQINTILLPLSYVFLFIFSARSIIRQKPKLKFLYFFIPLFVGLCATAYFTAGALIASICARYFICTPAVLLAAWSFFTYLYKPRQLKLPVLIYISTWFLIVDFLLYGIFSGLIVPKANFIFADIINYSSFKELFKLPIQVYRSICALIIAIAMAGLINTYRIKNGIIRFRGGIRGKITILVLSSAACLVILAAFFAYMYGAIIIINTVRADYQNLVNAMSVNISNKIDTRLIMLELPLSESAIINDIKSSNLNIKT